MAAKKEETHFQFVSRLAQSGSGDSIVQTFFGDRGPIYHAPHPSLDELDGEGADMDDDNLPPEQELFVRSRG
jgi:hypothetical protein